MPKILINEKDYTSPGAGGDYSNYAVLLTGFAGRKPVLLSEATAETPADAIQPDSNGAYEFSSAENFKNIIGLVRPEITIAGKNTLSHYGNQMAYELLKIGYKIVYKPICVVEFTSDGDLATGYGYANILKALKDATEASFWKPFKDKASYDFRFITHGFLNADNTESDADIADLDVRHTALTGAKTKIDEIKAAAKVYVDGLPESDPPVDASVELVDRCEFLFSGTDVKDKYDEELEGGPAKAKNEILKKYDTFSAAETGIQADLDSIESEQTALEADIFTTANINTANASIAGLANYTASGAATDDSGQPSNDISDKLIYKNTGRGDCIALLELDERTYITTDYAERPENNIIDAINILAADVTADLGRYSALTVPSVVYKMADMPVFGNNKKFPGSFHYLTCFINSLKTGFAEWYAAAGYTRGVSNYTVDYTTVKLGEIAINALEPRDRVSPNAEFKVPTFACNVIANFRGSYYLWGNRTAYHLNSTNLVAQHFLNIRQLSTTIKKQLYVACRRFTFDPNSDTLWYNFVNAIKPTLERMKAGQGIRDYKIIREASNIKAALKAKIRIIPIEAVEDFDIEVSLEDSFGETSISAD